MSVEKERRGCVRCKKEFLLEYQPGGSKGEEICTKDISCSGIAFLNNAIIESGSVIKVNLTRYRDAAKGVDERVGISVMARVVRVEKNGSSHLVAAQFLNTPRRTIEMLEIYLES